MSATEIEALDSKYLAILVERIKVCENYKPKFGKSGKPGLTLQEFTKLYHGDDFYSWFGLDTPWVYAAHKAAGGITSVYRQIGIGCEQVFRLVLQDQLGLSDSQAKWSYETTGYGKKRTLSLDGRIDLKDVRSTPRQKIISQWLLQAAKRLNIAPEIAQVLKGAVFEVRQGYKSKDSKRQNADIANAATAYSQGYLPVIVTLSTQIDSDIASRYEGEKWLILQGYVGGSSTTSTYVFANEVIGYDLAAFFQRNSGELRKTIEEVSKVLLGTDERND
ncbi:MAG: hypothetical protein ACOYYU_04460 [Chloroflexota bacterium]